jgi:hypothetical protein
VPVTEAIDEVPHGAAEQQPQRDGEQHRSGDPGAVLVHDDQRDHR